MIARKTNAAVGKANTAYVLPSTRLELAEALQGFKTHAMLASTVLVDMVASAALIFVIGYWLVPEGKRLKKDVIREKVDAILKSVNPTKATSTLAAYVTTATNLFRVMTDSDHAHQRVREYAPVIGAIAACKTIEEAQDVLVAHLKGKGVDGLDKLKAYCGVATSNQTERTVTEKATAAITNAMKATTAAMEDNKANITPAKAAMVLANAIPASIKPEVMVKASLARIGTATEAAKAAQDACMHLAHLDVDAFDAFVVRMVKMRDTMLEAKAKPATAKRKAKPADKTEAKTV